MRSKHASTLSALPSNRRRCPMFVFLPVPISQNRRTNHRPQDQTVGSLNWSVIEVGTAIVCACLASLRPLAARYLPSIFSNISQHTPELPSLRFDTTSTFTSKAQPQSPISRAKSTREEEGSIYVRRTFDLTELDVLSRERGEEEGIRSGKKRKQSETTTAWTQASRRSSQEVLVRDPGVRIAK